MMAFTASAAATTPMFNVYKDKPPDSCSQPVDVKESPVTMEGMVGADGCFAYCLNVTGVFGGFQVSGADDDLLQTTIYGYAGHGCATNSTVGYGYINATIPRSIGAQGGINDTTQIQIPNDGCQKMNFAPDASGNSSVQIYRGNCEQHIPNPTASV